MPSVVGQLKQADSTDLLTGVVERNYPIRLELKQGDTWVGYRSRFLGVAPSDQADAPALWIEAPTAEDERGNPLSAGQTFVANFALGQSFYRFTSTVIRLDQFELTGGQSVAGTLVEWPTEIEKVERRRNFRCDIPLSQPVEATLWPGGKNRKPASPKGRDRVFRGRMVNASLGGSLVRLSGPDDPKLAFGSTIGMEFTLEPGGPLLAGRRHNSQSHQA